MAALNPDHSTATEHPSRHSADQFAERLVQSFLGWAEISAVYAGDRLGWYRSLAAHGPSTADELAQRTGTSARYAREWLEQQAVSGVLVADAATDAARRRYTLPPGHAEALTDETSLAYTAPLGRLAAAAGTHLPALLAAYRSGGGVSWQQLGADAREAQADLNRPWFTRLPDVFGGIERVNAVLRRPDVRVADVGMGAGWSSISLALGYPGLQADGFDVDEPSVELARANAADAGVGDRVRFHVADGDALDRHGPFDAVFAFECVHDMPHPVDVLRAMRRAVKDDGIVIIMDEAVAERFGGPGDELDPVMYAFSLFVCLPDGMSGDGMGGDGMGDDGMGDGDGRRSAATGTVMRPDTLRRYAQEAGFDELEILPIEDFGFFRFYDLRFSGDPPSA